MPADRENVTVLFTDMVGSTRLFSQLSVEAAYDLRERHFSLLRQSVAASGGAEVQNLGDGMMVVFSATSSAIECAVAMQQGIERENRESDFPIGLRIGASCGEAIREDNDYFGDPIVEAARLCAMAEGGQVLVTDLVKGMAGRRTSHRLEPIGRLELKGFSEPIESYEVVWAPLTPEAADERGQVPLPARLAHRPNVGVIGRVDALAALDDAVKGVETGMGRAAVLISGEPGQGKTTLVAETARRAHAQGATVLFGRCDEELGIAYRPFRELLGHYVAHTSEGTLRRHVESYGGELVRLVPALHQRLPDLPEPISTDPDTERYLLFGAAVGLLDEASKEVPVVVILDDLHWVDKPTVQLLRHLVSHTASRRLLLLGTFRDSELSSTHPMSEALGEFRREPAVTRLQLSGFDDLGVLAYFERAAGHELDEVGVGLAHAVYRETDGNPFFVAEVLLNLVESGAIVRNDDGRWAPAHPDEAIVLPESVREVIDARVSRIGPGAAKVLSVAAVIGRDFDLDLLAEVSGQDEDTLLDLLDAARAGVLVREAPDAPGRYSFAHALIQRTLYDGLGTTRRTRAHLQVAEALEHLFGEDPTHAGELANHYFLATRPADPEKAIGHAVRAGEAALGSLAPDEAVRYFTQALELLDQSPAPDSITRIDCLIGLGTSQRQAGIPEFRTTLLEAANTALGIGQTDRLVAAALANHRGYATSLGHIDAEKVEVLEEALAALPATESSERARLLATLCSELAFGPVERRLSLFHESVLMARRLGEPTTFVAVVNDCTVPVRISTTLEEQLTNLREAQAIARDLGDPLALFWSSIWVNNEATRAGRFEEAEAAAHAAFSIADAVPQPMLAWVSAQTKVGIALLRGDLDGIEQLAEECLAIGTESAQPDAFTTYGSQLTAIRHQQGRLREVAGVIAQVAEEAPEVPVFLAVQATAHLDAGDVVSARGIIEDSARQGFDMEEDVAWSTAMANYAEVAVELDLGAAASVLLERIGPLSDQLVSNGLTHRDAADTWLGGLCTVLGRYREAEAHFAVADDFCTRGALRYSQAQNQLYWGRMLLRRAMPGDVEQGRDLLFRARGTATEKGYALIEKRATTALEAAGL